MHDRNADLVARYTLAKTIARDAGAFAYAYFKRRSELVVESKGTQDQVSVADRETEVFIRERIRSAFRDDGILGEEGIDESAGRRIIWVIDPIDGTACFVNGMFSWCVSIAVLVDGVVEMGAVFDPNSNELFHATRGGGAFVNDQAIRVKAASDFRAGLMGTSLSHRLPPEGFIRFLGTLLRNGGMFIRNGSGALSICYVAAGRFIGFYEPHINSWDCLAGIVIAEEAGAVVNDFLSNNGLYEGNPLIVASEALFPMLSEVIAKSNSSPAAI